jgi:hypothetical protein
VECVLIKYLEFTLCFMFNASSDETSHLHVQLSQRLEQDYQQRKSSAKGSGTIPPMVTGLTIRAVNITRKETEVKPKYYEAFHQTHQYPQRFPFTQKVILVFQQIEGVDVLIFVVYVQVSPCFLLLPILQAYARQSILGLCGLSSPSRLSTPCVVHVDGPFS